ncbi:MAG TPA: AarF/ABC1/UbiB kinase family protein [Allosphingosinicella sp.]
MGKLQDQVGGRAPALLRGGTESFERGSGIQLEEVGAEPIASGAIAFVYVVRLPGRPEPMILKIKRDGIDALMRADLRLLALSAKLVQRLFVGLQHIPLEEMARTIALEVEAQLDLTREARNAVKFAANFAASPEIRFPTIIEGMSRPDMLVMSFERGLLGIDPQSGGVVHKVDVYERLIRSVYVMLFVHGFFHCDVHPGNVFTRVGGEIVFLDCGLARQLSASDRDDFADFFLCVALNRGKRAAGQMLRLAIHVPANLDQRSYTREISAVVATASGVKAGSFSVVGFVTDLFEVNRRHGIVGTADFIWMITVLVTLEGPVKAACPQIDFQGIAIDVITEARLEQAA